MASYPKYNDIIGRGSGSTIIARVEPEPEPEPDPDLGPLTPEQVMNHMRLLNNIGIRPSMHEYQNSRALLFTRANREPHINDPRLADLDTHLLNRRLYNTEIPQGHKNFMRDVFQG